MSVRVARGDLDAHPMPRVCAKSGQPATTTVRTIARAAVPNSARLLALGVVPYFVAQAHRVDHLAVDIPAAAAVADRLARLTYVARATSLASVIVVVVGAVATSVAILIGGVLVGAASLAAAAAVRAGWVDARLTGDDGVVLERVHPAFVRSWGMAGARLR